MFTRVAVLAAAIAVTLVPLSDSTLVRAEFGAARSEDNAGTAGRDLSWIVSYVSGSLDSVEVRDPTGRAITRKRSDIPEAQMYDIEGYVVPHGGHGIGLYIGDAVEGEYSLRAVAAEESTLCDVNVSGTVKWARRCESDSSFILSKGQAFQLSVHYEVVGPESCAVRFTEPPR